MTKSKIKISLKLRLKTPTHHSLKDFLLFVLQNVLGKCHDYAMLLLNGKDFPYFHPPQNLGGVSEAPKWSFREGCQDSRLFRGLAFKGGFHLCRIVKSILCHVVKFLEKSWFVTVF